MKRPSQTSLTTSGWALHEWGHCCCSMGHNATIEYAVAKIHRRGPQDRCEHQPEIFGHAGLDNHLYAASSTAGGKFAYSALSMSCVQTPPQQAGWAPEQSPPLGGDHNAWSHQGLHGARSRIWMHCQKMWWNERLSATHDFYCPTADMVSRGARFES